MGNTQGLESSGKLSSGNATKDDLPMPLRDELEEQFAQLVAHMNLPEDKKHAVMDSSIEKKWQMIKDMEKRSPQLPPKEYLNKIKSMMEEENVKVQDN